MQQFFTPLQLILAGEGAVFDVLRPITKGTRKAMGSGLPVYMSRPSDQYTPRDSGYTPTRVEPG